MNFMKRLITPQFTRNEYLRLRFKSLKSAKITPKDVYKSTTKTSPNTGKKPRLTEAEQYFSSDIELIKIKDYIPSRFFKKNRSIPDDLYLIDRKIANEIATTLLPNILDQKKCIIETNPGLGLLTRELLNAGVPKIQVYESNATFREQITKLGSEYPGRITQFDTDFFLIWKLSYQDRHDNGDRVNRMISNVETKEWSEDPCMTIIGTLTSSNFIRYLILSLIFQFGIMTRGRCEMYICIPPTIYAQLTAGPETGNVFYRASSVLFQLLFDFQIFKKIPRIAFLPQYKSLEPTKVHPRDLTDINYLYLTRIEFKRELPVPMDRLQHLWYFVRYMMISRKKRIIPCLEKWIPGCGARFIVQSSNEGFYPDMHIYTQIGQLTAPQILNLYKEFSNLPEYSESPFVASMESTLLKMETSSALEEPVKEVHDDSQTQHENKRSNIENVEKC